MKCVSSNLISIAYLIVLNVSASAEVSNRQQAIEASSRFRESLIKREYESCMRHAESGEAFCKPAVQSLMNRDRTAGFALLREAGSASKIYQPQMEKEFERCTKAPNYASYVWCLEVLRDRVEDALRGETLLSRAR